MKQLLILTLLLALASCGSMSYNRNGALRKVRVRQQKIESETKLNQGGKLDFSDREMVVFGVEPVEVQAVSDEVKMEVEPGQVAIKRSREMIIQAEIPNSREGESERLPVRRKMKSSISKSGQKVHVRKYPRYRTFDWGSEAMLSVYLIPFIALVVLAAIFAPEITALVLLILGLAILVGLAIIVLAIVIGIICFLFELGGWLEDL